MKEKRKQLVEGSCFICGKPCQYDAYVHFACAIAYEDAKKGRVKKLMEKYGDGLKFERKLVSEEE